VEALPEPAGVELPPTRDATVLGWLAAGQLERPEWLEVRVSPELVVWVMNDAVKFGGVRVCCSVLAAQAIADAWGALLLTSGLVMAYWRRAKAHGLLVDAHPMGGKYVNSRGRESWCNPGGALEPWLAFQDWIETEIRTAYPLPEPNYERPGMLSTCGKDYILDTVRPPGVQSPIFGFVTKGGRALHDPLGSNHHPSYFDYSHSVRLAHRTARWRGELVDLAEVYADRRAWPVLSVGARATAIPSRI